MKLLRADKAVVSCDWCNATQIIPIRNGERQREVLLALRKIGWKAGMDAPDACPACAEMLGENL